MGYPNTKFIWDDQTVKQNIPEANSLSGKPVYMSICSSDKGPEGFRIFDKDFVKRYGNISFAKHGQPQLQTAKVLDVGGAVYHHRVVAPDSALANMSLVATVSQVKTQKLDPSGAKLYLTVDGTETTAAEGNTPIMISKAKVKYEVMSVTDLTALTKMGDDPKKIAEAVKKQVDLDNVDLATSTNPDRVPGDDLTNMGHATITYENDADGGVDKKTTVTAKAGATLAKVLLRVGRACDTIKAFDPATATDVTASAATGFKGCDVGNNTVYVEYTDPNKYPAELYVVTVEDEADALEEGALVLDMSALKALLDRAYDMTNTGYTDETWDAFKRAQAAAAIVFDTEHSQTDVSRARVDLQYAIDSLKTNEAVQGETHKYLLWTITDSGRGDSIKRISITPNYQASKNSAYCKYMINVLEGTESTDVTLMFSINPDIIDAKTNRSIDAVVNANSLQIRAVSSDADVLDFLNDIAIKAGIDVAEVKENDVLFGHTKKGKEISWIVVDGTGVTLDSTFGLPLKGGSNGSFGSKPIESDAYFNEVKKAFTGEYDMGIYDIDNVPICAIFDCNYPVDVKHAIEEFVAFREDCFYFRDLGLGLDNLDDILAANIDMAKSKFCASYHNSYDVVDPYTRKQISVTCMYDLAAMFVAHYNNGVIRPFAGIQYGIIFDNIVEGSVNFIPKKIPAIDEGAELYDANINYMKYYDGVLTMDTEKTAQDAYSDLSYINNVLGIQDIIRDVRRRCPKIRYSFINGDDFTDYQKDINQVLSRKSGWFDHLELVYLQDMAQTDRKCYFAAIKTDAKDFIESEYFKVSVINA